MPFVVLLHPVRRSMNQPHSHIARILKDLGSVSLEQCNMLEVNRQCVAGTGDENERLNVAPQSVQSCLKLWHVAQLSLAET